MKKIIIILALALGVYSECTIAKSKATDPTLIAAVQKNTESKTVSSQDLDDESDKSDSNDSSSDPSNAASNQQDPNDALESMADSIQKSEGRSDHSDFPFTLLDRNTIIPIIAISLFFLTPLLIILIVFIYKYKNKRARYRVAEEALRAGQPVPEGLFNGGEGVKTRTTYSTTSDGKRIKRIEMSSDPLREKAIKNICLGIGLFIFLWALTGIELGCIGLLIACMGVGEYIIARDRKINEMNKIINEPEEAVNTQEDKKQQESKEVKETTKQTETTPEDNENGTAE